VPKNHGRLGGSIGKRQSKQRKVPLNAFLLKISLKLGGLFQGILRYGTFSK
jgi:hypothetical protein